MFTLISFHFKRALCRPPNGTHAAVRMQRPLSTGTAERNRDAAVKGKRDRGERKMGKKNYSMVSRG